MKTIAVMANKGGVGKTGITLGLAGAAAHRGLAVLVIDLDPQGNATSHLKTRKGRIVSKKKHAAGLKAIKKLFAKGYKPKKGTFKLMSK